MTYFSIENGADHEIIIDKSRFICYFSRVNTVEQAQEFITTIKKKHWDATHNCSAYIVGDNQQYQKANDDGEPSGTAGVPMLEVLKKRQLTNIVTVVTRYFGGIKLGAGGLVRAYTQCVATALDQQAIVTQQIPLLRIQCMLSFEHAFKVENTLRQDKRFIIESVEYLSTAVTMFILLDSCELVTLPELIQTLCNQEVDIYELDTIFYEKSLFSD